MNPSAPPSLYISTQFNLLPPLFSYLSRPWFSNMDSSPSSLLICLPLEGQKQRDGNGGVALCDSYPTETQAKIPGEYIWPRCERPQGTPEELAAPVVDLAGFFRGDERATWRAAELVGEACRSHGCFQVTNHGVGAHLLREALGCTDAFFRLPHAQKLRAGRKPGGPWGYAGAHADRFTSKLPWKETLSFGYQHSDADSRVVEYFTSVLGKEFRHMG